MAAVCSAFTIAVAVLVGAVALSPESFYATIGGPVRSDVVATAPQGTGEVIGDDEVPMAAAPGSEGDDTVTSIVIGGGVCAVVAFFVVRIRKLDGSMTAMRRKLH